MLAAWGIDTDGKPVFVGLAPASSESTTLQALSRQGRYQRPRHPAGQEVRLGQLTPPAGSLSATTPRRLSVTVTSTSSSRSPRSWSASLRRAHQGHQGSRAGPTWPRAAGRCYQGPPQGRVPCATIGLIDRDVSPAGPLRPQKLRQAPLLLLQTGHVTALPRRPNALRCVTGPRCCAINPIFASVRFPTSAGNPRPGPAHRQHDEIFVSR